MTEALDVATLTALIGSSLMGGVFFTFSNFVMKALGRLDDREGVAAMLAINVTVLNPLFFVAFFGTGVLCVATALLALGDVEGTHAYFCSPGRLCTCSGASW